MSDLEVISLTYKKPRKKVAVASPSFFDRLPPLRLWLALLSFMMTVCILTNALFDLDWSRTIFLLAGMILLAVATGFAYWLLPD